MRIRRCASRLLGSAYSPVVPDAAPRFELPFPLPLSPPPQPPPPAGPCSSAPESHAGDACFAAETASGEEPCELSLSPWDLIAQLDLSDPQEEVLVVDTYFVHVASRASWLFPASMPAASVKEEVVATVDEGSPQPRHKVAKKMVKKKTVVKKEESEPKKKAKVKTEECDGVAAGGAQIWTCKKTDGKRWFCHRPVSRPNSLCEYHSDQNRPQCNLFAEGTSTAPPATASSAPSKPSTSTKPRRKKTVDAGEGFYYYAGFGPSRSKRHCKTSSMQQEPPPAEQEEEAPPEDHDVPTAGQSQADDGADHQAAAVRGDEPSCDDMAGIAGGDEESSDDDRHGCNGNGEPRVVGVNGDSKRKSPARKRWRKPVKARSLKSLM